MDCKDRIFALGLILMLVGAAMFFLGYILPSNTLRGQANMPLAIFGVALIIIGTAVGTVSARKKDTVKSTT
jgi:disulfide bond formation protein DsbB